VSYRLSDDANGRFVIDSATGEVKVGASHLLDYESSDSHTITVEAVASGGSTAETDFTISVTDEDEPLEIYQISRSGDTITYGVKVNTSFYDADVSSWGFTVSFDPSELTFAGTTEANGNVTSGATNLNGQPILLSDLLDDGVSGSDGVADSLTFGGFAFPAVAHDFTQPVATFDMTLGTDVVEAGLFTPDVENKDYTSFGSTRDFTPNKAVFDYTSATISGVLSNVLTGQAMSNGTMYVAEHSAVDGIFIRAIELGETSTFEIVAKPSQSVSAYDFTVSSSGGIDGFTISQGVDSGVSPSVVDVNTYTLDVDSGGLSAGIETVLATFSTTVSSSGMTTLALENVQLDGTSISSVSSSIQAVSLSSDGAFSVDVSNGSYGQFQVSVEDANPFLNITPDDALDALKLWIGFYGDASIQEVIASDMNKDGIVTPDDALEILKSWIGFDVSQPTWSVYDADASLNLTLSNSAFSEIVDLGTVTASDIFNLEAVLTGDVSSWIA
jgi:hypothetical protein